MNIIKKILACICAATLGFTSTALFAASASFTADTTTALDTNPERGFYFHLQPAEWCNGFGGTVRDGISDGGVVQPVRLMYYEHTLASSLTTLNTNLGCARTLGVKVIFASSASYCSNGISCVGAISK